MVGLQPIKLFAVVLFFSAIFCRAQADANGGTLPENLKCEWRVNPLGIDVLQPHFSWTLISLDPDHRGARQTAYQVLVSSSQEALAADTADEWDSGRVDSPAVFQIQYAGKTPQPGTRHFWKIRVWDEAGHASPWSYTAEYLTGMLASSNWKAHWIAASADDAPSPPGQPLPLFRHEFLLRRGVQRAVVFVSGLGHYELRLNGQNVTTNLLTPGWTNYRKHVFYNAYDVTDLLRAGNNSIGVLLGNGMYNVSQVPGRYTKFAASFGQPKVIVEMHLTLDDNTEMLVTSDKTWTTAPGPITFSSVYGGEDYDARLEQSGWDLPGFRAAWQPAVEVSGPGGELVGGIAAPVQALHDYLPVKTTQPKPDVTVYDLGQNFSGWPEITVTGPEGATVKLTTGELLDSDGLVTQHSANASPERQNSFSYTLRGAGKEVWHPRFSYWGFRYIQVEGAVSSEANPGNQPQIQLITGQFLHDAVDTAGGFDSSKTLFGQVHRLIDMAIMSNLFSVLTDCPHREKLGWLEQTYLAGPSILLNHDAISLYQKMAQDIRDSQLPDGMVPGIAPEFVAFVDDKGANTGFRDSPEWGSAVILSPWTVYQFYGDKALLAAQYDSMRAYAAYLQSKTKDNILAYGLGDWYDVGPGAPGESQLTSKALTATAIYFADLTVLGKVAALLDKPDDAATYAAAAAQVKDAFNRELFHPENDQYDRGSQTANAMPLALGLVPEGREAAVLQNLVRDIRNHDDHVTAGDIGFHYVVRALTDNGRSDVLYDMLSRTDSPSYGYQLAQGATTLTEAWDTNPNSSQNHFMVGHGEEWFYRGLAGINLDFDRPENERITIHPYPVGDIESASASYQSVFGEIRSAWSRKARHFALHVIVPAGAVATIEIPTSDPATVHDGEKALSDDEGIISRQPIYHGVSCVVAAGEYQFTSEL